MNPLTRRAVDLFEKEPLKGNSEVHLHTPTKFGEDRSKDLGGDREQTDRQTNRQTDKRCSIYSMMRDVLFLQQELSPEAPMSQRIRLLKELGGSCGKQVTRASKCCSINEMLKTQLNENQDLVVVSPC